MRKPLVSTLLLATSFGLFASTAAKAAKPWELLIPFARVEAEAGKQYRLTTDHGPWMILASSFAGPGAEQQASQLALELREELTGQRTFSNARIARQQDHLGTDFDGLVCDVPEARQLLLASNERGRRDRNWGGVIARHLPIVADSSPTGNSSPAGRAKAPPNRRVR